MIYIRRYGSSAIPDPMPDQSLAAYRNALAAKYDHQIRLLRTAKFWYLLPMYLAVLVMLAGVVLERARTRPLVWSDAIPVIGQTLFFAAVWWLNEVHGVRKLKKARMQLDCN